MNWKRVRRTLSGGAVLLLLVGGVLLTAAYFWLRTSARVPSGPVRLGDEGLTDTVGVYVDSFAVPHAFAGSLEDLLFAEGWLHGSHRLWQMEVLRRTAQGRLSELFGPAALDADRLLRTLDLWGSAGRAVEALGPGERTLLRAYTRGVNAAARRASPLPPEFLLLGVEPEPWTPQASVAVGRVMALDLTSWERELSRWHASRVLPAEKFEFLRAGYPDWAPTVLEDSLPVPEVPDRRRLAADPPLRSPSGTSPGSPPETSPRRSHAARGTAGRACSGPDARLASTRAAGESRAPGPRAVSGSERAGCSLTRDSTRSGRPRLGSPVRPSRRGVGARRRAAAASGEDPGGEREGPARGESSVTGGERWDPVAFLSRFSVARASNAWAVSGARTASGGAVVANDMHLSLQAPAIWYLAGLHAERPPVDVAGLTLPGVPGVVVGYNRRLAWGFTNGMVDDMDFAVETVSRDGERYRHRGEWREFRVRRETIRSRGAERPVVHRVRETVRGPVITDALDGVEGTLSVLWTASRPGRELSGLLAMNRAETVAEFDRAVRRFRLPHQNVVFGSVSGEVAYRLGGTVPLRDGWTGELPVPAGQVGEGWAGFWPPDAHPSLREPEAGFVATANNLQAPNLHGVVGSHYPLPFRARRLVDRLRTDSAWNVEKTADLARDTRSLFAERVLARAEDAARRAGEEEAAGHLASWDLEVDEDSRGALLFYVWLYRLRDLVAGDEYGGYSRWAWFPDGALLRMLEGEADAGWADDVTTGEVETLELLEEGAAREAAEAAGGRSWGEVHRERHTHLLGRSPVLEALFGFHVGPYPGPGAPHTLRPDDYRRWEGVDTAAWRPPFVSDYGPSERFVAELGPEPEGARGFFLLPTGQSGNPFSRHYRDMAPLWESSGAEPPLIPVPVEREEARGRAVRSFHLVPKLTVVGGVR